MIPIGTSRCGRRASSAWVETESKPMYEKKMIAAPASIPSGWPCSSIGPNGNLPKKAKPA